MRTTRHALFVATLLATAVSFAACTGGGDDGGDGPDPTPTPAFPADRCHIVWSTESAERTDLFVLDAPFASWVTSTSHALTTGTAGFRATFLGDYDVLTDSAVVVAAVTTGTISVVTAEPGPASFLSFDSEVPRPLFHVDSAGTPVAFAGTGGTGSFSGFWSDPWSANVSPGSGTIAVLVEGTARTLGSDLSYAVCYEVAE